MDEAYWMRVVIALVASCIVGLCFTNIVWIKSSQVRNARVAGLGFVCVAIAWGTHARRNEEFKPWLILLLVGLLLSAYGMARSAPGEKSKVKIKSTESP